MKTFLKTGILLISIGLFSVACQNETNRKEKDLKIKIQNLETFARLYGYARWFHPSDEAQKIDWDKFAIFGVQKVENVKSAAELRDTLYNLFSPIVQGLQIYEERKPEIFDPGILLSPDPNAKPVAWLHYGVYLSNENIYKSIRTNTDDINKIESTAIYREVSNISHLIGKEVKLSAYFKTDKEGAKLSIQAMVSSENIKMSDIEIESEDWEKYELTLTIPHDATHIFYGFEVSGDAEVWADDFEFVVNNRGVWEPIDTANMGFESGQTEEEMVLIEGWDSSLTFHTVEVTDENPYSGKYCLKVSFPGKMSEWIPQLNEITKASIGNGLICVVPLTLLITDSVTYPQTEITVLNQLQSELAEIQSARYISDTRENLASIIIAWNVLQHFFPYFDVIDTDWNEVLKETLERTLRITQKKDFYITLSQMFAKIKDGHGIVYSEQMFHLPIRTEFIEDKIVITASNDTSLRRGDILHTIDGKTVMEVLDEKEKIISGSPHLRRHRALNILSSKFNSRETHLVIERDGKEQSIIVSNSESGGMFFNPVDERPYLSETIIEIEPEIYYINMANCTENEFEQKKDILASAKAVIYDQRGSKKLNFFQIMPYLIEEPVNSTHWNIPLTVYPDRKEVKFTHSIWDIHPKQPLFKSKTIIINVPSVVSAGETMIGIIDHYNLATTVGEPTAGCNGNINIIKMPCGYSAWFTGMKVLKHDGSQLYLKGFKPDYPVHKTIRAIREGRDEYLEKALEVARQE